MDVEESSATVAEINTGTRKRSKRKRQTAVLRETRYGDIDPLILNGAEPCNCNHNEKSKFLCKKISLNAIVRHRQRFYNHKNKVQQDIFLTRFIAPYEPERRKSSGMQTKKRVVSVTYYLSGKKKKRFQVCKSFFMKVFSVKKDRLSSIAKTVFEGKIPKENRGGARRNDKNERIKDKIREFLERLPATESHYNRNKSKRSYLSSELNITKLRKMYNDCVTLDLEAKKTMFWGIFTSDFNLGFRSPASDACSTCLLLCNKIAAETDSDRKKILIVEKRVHKLRAQYFYKLAKMACSDSVTFCFDLQQVQPLPRTPIQDAFYARQISFYNFCIVPMDSKHPKFYQWSEEDSGRGSIEVGSALLSYLNELDLAGRSKVRLFCDGCGGQNKNSHIVHALLFWLVNKSPENIQEIQLTFPVRGHSFLPADRVFGRVEKDLRKKPVIIQKEDYYQIYKNHGEIKILGEEWKTLDIKSLEENYKKLDGMRDIKRVVIKKHLATKKIGRRVESTIKYLVNTYKNFRNESDEERRPFCLLKRGKRHPTVLIQKNYCKGLSAAKKQDVNNLMKKQFGDDWMSNDELKWYKNLLENDTHNQHEDDEGHFTCDCIEDEVNNILV